MQLFPALPEVVQGTFRPALFGRLERLGGGPCERGIFIVDHTTNYQLSQWEATDRILMSDFNDDNAKIDAALKSQADAIAAKAAQSALDTVSGQLAAEVAQRQAADTALENQVGLKLIKTVDVPSGSGSAQVSLTDLAWGSWKTVHMLLHLPMRDGHTVMCYLNGNTDASVADATGDTRCLVSFFPMYNVELPTAGLLLGRGNETFSFWEIPYKNASYLQLVALNSNDVIPEGSQVVFYGEK